jgi:hypothetical protein
MAGCDSTPDGLAPCAGRTDGRRCVSPTSEFPQEDPIARQIQGRVLRGTEAVAGAIVHLEPAVGLTSDQALRTPPDPRYMTSTDLGGKYHILQGPFFYDLTVRKDLEIGVFRGVSSRSFEPPLGEDAPVVGFTGTIHPTLMPPPAPGNAVAFFVSGMQARSVSGDTSALTATFRLFDTVITLNAIEYVAAGGLTQATRFGTVDVHVTSGAVSAALLPMNDFDTQARSNDIRFYPGPLADGFAVDSLEVLIGFGVRTSLQVAGHVAPGERLHLQSVAQAIYFVHGMSTRDGATTDSGLLAFDPLLKNSPEVSPSAQIAVLMPPPIAVASFDGSNGLSAMGVANVLLPDGSVEHPMGGIIEHVLVPSAPGQSSIRITTTESTTTVPDLTSLGLARPVGPYLWSVQHFPTVLQIDYFSGEDARKNAPFSSTVPRLIELR